MQSTRAGSNPAIATNFGRPLFLPEIIYDWSYDPEQSEQVAYTPSLDSGCYNYRFAGWYFIDSGLITPITMSHRVGHLRLTAVLHNPEAPNLYLSYHSYRDKPEEILIPQRVWDWLPGGKKYAAAWLIAHWYEHFLHSCPCLLDDHKESRFRYACIDGFREFDYAYRLDI